MLTGIGCVKKPKNWPAQSFTENKTAFALECHSAAFPRASRDRTHYCTHYHTRPPQARQDELLPDYTHPESAKSDSFSPYGLLFTQPARSEERRVGKECRDRW